MKPVYVMQEKGPLPKDSWYDVPEYNPFRSEAKARNALKQENQRGVSFYRYRLIKRTEEVLG